MTDNPRKLVGVFATLLGVWLVAYWAWPESRAPVEFDARPPVVMSSAPASNAGAMSAPPVLTQVEPTRLPGAGNAAPVRVIEKPKFRDYLVRKGDVSFEAIAARPEVFGDRRLAGAIAAANPMVSPNKLIVGRTVLRIPLDPKNIQGREVTIAPPAAKAPEKQPDPVPAARATEVYVVQPGDTLSGIAKAKYGRSALWEMILEANSDVLTDPAKLRPGMKLRIPPAPKSAD
ncbi:MAG: LysM peptidoglycan-binding domain-containing protein [Phycisphaerales bacterium]